MSLAVKHWKSSISLKLANCTTEETRLDCLLLMLDTQLLPACCAGP